MSKVVSLLCAVVMTTGVVAAEEAHEEQEAQEENVNVEIVTSMGSMTVELWPSKAPATVQNFLERVDEGFYDGLIFHRVMANFMIQGGGFDPDMNAREPPHTVVNESSNGAPNRLWTIAMARRADPDSAGAQFYINTKDNEHLNARPGQPGYTVFGELTAGMDVAEQIELTETGMVGGLPNVPLKPIVIETIRRVEPPED